MTYNNLQEMGKPVKIRDEGVLLTSRVGSIDFVGAGVIGTALGSDVTETISGGGETSGLVPYTGATGDVNLGSRILTASSIGIGTTTPGQKLDIAYGHQRFTQVIAPTAPTATLKATTPGNIDNGSHLYKITYVTASGETEIGATSNTIVVTNRAVGGQIDLTNIPVSTNPLVTQRKIYRTKVGSIYLYYLVATLTNNTATTYTDNIADSSLVFDGTNKPNSTAGSFFLGTIPAGRINYSNVGLGYNLFPALTSGFHNTILGTSALSQITTGAYNVALGVFAGNGVTTGIHNFYLGTYSGGYNPLGQQNVGIGSFTLGGAANFNFCIGIGMNAGRYNTGSGNTMIGNNSGWTGSVGAWATLAGSNNTFIGNSTGQASATQRNKAMAFGYNAVVDADNTCAIGGTGVDKVSVVIGGTTANARLDSKGSFAAGYVAKTAAYTLGLEDYTINCTANSFTITLPTAVGCQGRIYNIENSGTGSITIATTAGQTIDNKISNEIILNQWSGRTVQSTGANWIILNSKNAF